MPGFLSPKDIILAEDDVDDVEIFKLALNELGFPYRLRHADNGEKLFLLLKERIPYILFLDIEMPCKDGLSCIVEIRKDREFDQLPIIMYTSQLHPRFVEESHKNGANLYLGKPNTFKALVANLRTVFSKDWENNINQPPSDHFFLI